VGVVALVAATTAALLLHTVNIHPAKLSYGWHATVAEQEASGLM
jgi:hypothetical protein